MSHACRHFWNCHKTITFCSLWQGAKFPGACQANHILSSKSAPRMVCFVHFDLECASRHNGVHFLNISTSKSAPTLVCFVHFDFEMCFAPQRRALFRRVNVQKCCGVVVFFAFWLGNVLRTTTACILLSLIPPYGSTPAALASLLVDPPELSRLFYLFARLHLLSSDSFFWLFLFSDSSHPCFSIYIVGSLTSKPPSIMSMLLSYWSCQPSSTDSTKKCVFIAISLHDIRIAFVALTSGLMGNMHHPVWGSGCSPAAPTSCWRPRTETMWRWLRGK